MYLGQLISGFSDDRPRDRDLLVGFENRDDAGVYRLRDDLALVQTVDVIAPVSDDPYIFGQIAAANALSDIYAMGGTPITAMNICNFPAALVSTSTPQEILQGALSKLQEAGTVLLGGHTVRDERLKFGLSVTGLIDPKHILTNAGALPGDVLVLTKPIGTGLLITGYRSGKVSDDDFKTALDLMAALNLAACTALAGLRVHACTDVSGFGLAGHAMEVANASNVALRLDFSAIPVYPASLDLMSQGVRTSLTEENRAAVSGLVTTTGTLKEEDALLLFDPQTSGGLLISLPIQDANELVTRLEANDNAHASIIGQVVSGPPRLELSD